MPSSGESGTCPTPRTYIPSLSTTAKEKLSFAPPTRSPCPCNKVLRLSAAPFTPSSLTSSVFRLKPQKKRGAHFADECPRLFSHGRPQVLQAL